MWFLFEANNTFRTFEANNNVGDLMETVSFADINNKPVVMVFQDRPRYTGSNEDMAEYDKIVEQMKAVFIRDGYPMYPNIRRAAAAVSRMISYYQKRG